MERLAAVDAAVLDRTGTLTAGTLFVLIPLSLALLGVAIWALFWAIDSGQFDDLDTAAKAYASDEEDEVRKAA